MNTPFVRWLLDLDTIPADAEGLRLAFERPWAGWTWLLLIVLALGLAIWSYSRMSGARSMRAALAGLRGVLILLVLLVVSGPVIELPRETVEQDWVLVLADRSASMTIADAENDDGGPRDTRDMQLDEVLAANGEMLGALADDRQVVWLGFHVGAFNLADATAGPADLGAADGPRTDLDTALEQALQRAAARPVSGIVVLSDGRTVQPPSRAVVRRLQADQIPVFTVPLGSADPLGDLAIRRVDAPGRAFVRDKVPVVVELDHLGSAATADAVVRLIDRTTGTELDSVELDDGPAPETLTLIAEPQLAGDASWQVVIETTRPDLIPENNLQPFEIALIDRPLRVLYVEGYPRWEYTFVKDLLVREESIESSVFLLSADRDFAQEGNLPITRLPRSPEEFADYDAIIIGDVPGTFFSPEQLEMIRDHVALRGAGLLWIGGERNTPNSYVGTAAVLADLLPMRGSLNLDRIDGPVTMQPTPLADRLGVLRLALRGSVGWPHELRDPDYGWSRLQWAQQMDPGRLKPTAEVLAETVEPVHGARLPLVTFMRYGAGQTIYVATDEVWRWRYGRGSELPEQFWLQMIRMLGRESLGAGGDAALLEARPRRVDVGQPVRIDLRVLDARRGETLGSTVGVRLTGPGGEARAELELTGVEGDDGRWAATYLPDRPGAIEVTVTDPTLADLDLIASFDVLDHDDELRRPETDHPLLADLSTATGGAVLTADDFGRLAELLPNRSVRTINPLTERIWDTPLMFILVLLVITVEWVGRKVIRLV